MQIYIVDKSNMLDRMLGEVEIGESEHLAMLLWNVLLYEWLYLFGFSVDYFLALTIEYGEAKAEDG